MAMTLVSNIFLWIGGLIEDTHDWQLNTRQLALVSLYLHLVFWTLDTLDSPK